MEFKKKLVKLISKEAGCSIQHNGCPCNTCFHTWAEDELGLDSNLSHLFWIIILALRGDYTQDELIKANQKNCEELIMRADKFQQNEIAIGVYYAEDDDGKKTIDEDSMREEFENKFKEVTKNVGK